MTKMNAFPTRESISKAGRGLETTGAVVSLLCLALGTFSMFAGVPPVAFFGIAFGLLLMVAGYTKRIAAATEGMFMLQFLGLRETSDDQAR